MTISIEQAQNHFNSHLTELYESTELRQMFLILCEHFFNLPRHKVLAFPDTKIPFSDYNKLKEATEQLKHFYPLQYIVGETEFYDLTFGVQPSVLIPRPETEELVHRIIQEHKNQNINLLDIGTGSGCIPISLAANLPTATVSSLDVSEQALAIARENAERNNVKVQFYHCDVLQIEKLPGAPYDVIVSNPPYVMEKEKQQMKANVLDYEPHLALFVSDNDPLIFYRKIGDLAINNLKPNGKLYFEINEQLGTETAKMLEDQGFKHIKVHKDLYGKDRMVEAVKE